MTPTEIEFEQQRADEILVGIDRRNEMQDSTLSAERAGADAILEEIDQRNAAGGETRDGFNAAEWIKAAMPDPAPLDLSDLTAHSPSGGDDASDFDGELKAITIAWPDLPRDLRQEIRRMVTKSIQDRQPKGL